jgi:hypothetical protein
MSTRGTADWSSGTRFLEGKIIDYSVTGTIQLQKFYVPLDQNFFLLRNCAGNKVSSASIVTRLQTERTENLGSIPGRGRYYFSRVQTDPGTQPASYTTGATASFPGDKAITAFHIVRMLSMYGCMLLLPHTPVHTWYLNTGVALPSPYLFIYV